MEHSKGDDNDKVPPSTQNGRTYRTTLGHFVLLQEAKWRSNEIASVTWERV
jgi:hypothetical protein